MDSRANIWLPWSFAIYFSHQFYFSPSWDNHASTNLSTLMKMSQNCWLDKTCFEFFDDTGFQFYFLVSWLRAIPHYDSNLFSYHYFLCTKEIHEKIPWASFNFTVVWMSFVCVVLWSDERNQNFMLSEVPTVSEASVRAMKIVHPTEHSIVSREPVNNYFNYFYNQKSGIPHFSWWWSWKYGLLKNGTWYPEWSIIVENPKVPSF